MSAAKEIDVEAWKRNLRAAPMDDDASMRWFNNYFAFWFVCETGACKRGKRCAGDADACRDRFMPLVPQRMKVELQAALKAKSDGLSPDAVMRKVREELARFDDITRRLEALGMSGAGANSSSPLPACGERSTRRSAAKGASGEGESELADAPHPARHSASQTRVNALMARHPLPASGERERQGAGEGKASGPRVRMC